MFPVLERKVKLFPLGSSFESSKKDENFLEPNRGCSIDFERGIMTFLIVNCGCHNSTFSLAFFVKESTNVDGKSIKYY